MRQRKTIKFPSRIRHRKSRKNWFHKWRRTRIIRKMNRDLLMNELLIAEIQLFFLEHIKVRTLLELSWRESSEINVTNSTEANDKIIIFNWLFRSVSQFIPLNERQSMVKMFVAVRMVWKWKIENFRNYSSRLSPGVPAWIINNFRQKLMLGVEETEEKRGRTGTVESCEKCAWIINRSLNAFPSSSDAMLWCSWQQ